MANQIRLKRGTGSDPSASDLVTGELALRTDNGALFTKKDDGSVREIGPATGATDLVNDTSPQLGGNLDTNTRNIQFGDSAASTDDRLTFGAGTDLSIYHNGTDNYIDTVANKLRIRVDNSDDAVVANTNGSVELYHSNSKRFETTSGGATVTGDFTASAQVTANSSSSEAGFISRGDGSSTDGYIHLNCSKIVME